MNMRVRCSPLPGDASARALQRAATPVLRNCDIKKQNRQKEVQTEDGNGNRRRRLVDRQRRHNSRSVRLGMIFNGPSNALLASDCVYVYVHTGSAIKSHDVRCKCNMNIER